MVKSVATEFAKNVKKAKNADPKGENKNLSPTRVHDCADENNFE